MIFLLVFLGLLQEPAPQTPPVTEPPVAVPPASEPPVAAPQAPQQPAAPKSSRSREDSFEALVSEEAPAVADEPAPAQPPPAQPVDLYPGWVELNRCALIVNEELITLRDVQRGVARRARDQQRPNPNKQFMVAEEITGRARSMLQIGAGKDLGFDPEQVEHMINATMKRQTEFAGGVTRLAEGLKRDDKDSFARREDISDWVYNKLWTESVTGLSEGPGGRVRQDHYARPGRLLFEHREALKNQPKTRSVETTQLILVLGKPAAPGADERAVTRLEELRQRVLDGEDMGELAEQYGATEKGTRGRSTFLPLASLRRSNPEVADFLDHAEVGELSPVLPYLEGGKVAGHIVIRPEQFKMAPVENFGEPAGQKKIMEGYRERLDGYRIQMGLTDLLAAAYVWPPQSFSPSPPATPAP